jgi:uracil phosphoribosyltransferase
MSSSSLPPNVHVSTHPCLQAKLSQLRSSTATARDTKALVHEIALCIGYEATAAGLSTKKGEVVCSIMLLPSLLINHNLLMLTQIPPKAKTPLGYDYTTTTIATATISLVPILRSGLSMVDGTFLKSLLSNILTS